MTAVHVEGDTLTFQIASEVNTGQELLVTIADQATQEAQVRIMVEHCRSLDNGNFLVVARAPHPLPHASSEEVLGAREERRLCQRLRVMSPQFPEYSTLTLDVSRTGLRLDLDEPLEPGHVLPLEMSFPGLESDVSTAIEVVWCEPWLDGYQVGCRFLEPNDFSLRSALATLYDQVLPESNLPRRRIRAYR